MLGQYERQTWAKNKWIDDLPQQASSDAAYNVNDLIKPIKDSLSVNGHLYASPFYGESSFLMYRKDLLAKAGLTIPPHPPRSHIPPLPHNLNNPPTPMPDICPRPT